MQNLIYSIPNAKLINIIRAIGKKKPDATRHDFHG